MVSKKNLQANIDYHTALSAIYDTSQPHFRPENKKKVASILKDLSKQCGNKRLLDLGCGTGFVMELAHPYFQEIYGVDITPAMLDEARKKFAKSKKYHLLEASTDKMPFRDNYFNVLTGYSFLHHLSDLKATIQEAYRILRKGGCLYTDLDPNYYFWQMIKEIAKSGSESELMAKDIRTICHMVDDVSALAKDLKGETVKYSEIIESQEGGFKEEKIIKEFKKVGFRQVKIVYHWFWQEGQVIKDLGVKEATYMENHLRAGLPATRPLFKYFRIEATK